MPHVVMVSATRSMTCFSDDSRSGVPSVPRKYFWVTMLVALSDQVVGNSTPSCSKATDPSRKLVMRGVAPLPRDLVVGVHALGGEVAADADAGLLGGHGHGGALLGRGGSSDGCAGESAVPDGRSARRTALPGRRCPEPQPLVVKTSPVAPAPQDVEPNYTTVTTPVSTAAARFLRSRLGSRARARGRATDTGPDGQVEGSWDPPLPAIPWASLTYSLRILRTDVGDAEVPHHLFRPSGPASVDAEDQPTVPALWGGRGKTLCISRGFPLSSSTPPPGVVDSSAAPLWVETGRACTTTAELPHQPCSQRPAVAHRGAPVRGPRRGPRRRRARAGGHGLTGSAFEVLVRLARAPSTGCG